MYIKPYRSWDYWLLLAYNFLPIVTKTSTAIAMPFMLGNAPHWDQPLLRGLDLSTIWSTVSNYGPTDAPRDEKLGSATGAPQGLRWGGLAARMV